jgi:hypothetical protein
MSNDPALIFKLLDQAPVFINTYFKNTLISNVFVFLNRKRFDFFKN